MCFTSPMKFTKSILRPVRATRKGGASSLAFLSRHFRTTGGRRASTFFTITGKKRGGALDAHEPSSPKVTCIGQVRVKSKKRVKQCRRRIGEVSFRTAEQSFGQRIEDADKVWIRRQRFSNSGSQSHRDQRWVHLPVSVCAALRAFRAEICCFFPCKCCCFPRRGRESSTKSGCYPDENGCGAVFPRWLVAVNGGEGRKNREIEVVVAGEERAEMMSIRSSRRHVFEGFEVKDLVGEEEAAAASVSICIPPKNALLLMRCRSDPTKMAALENAARNDDIEEDNDGKEKESVVIDEEKEQEIEENDEGEVDGLGDVLEQENTTALFESVESCEKIEKEREEEETEELSEDKTQINSERAKPIQQEEEIIHSEQEEKSIQEEEQIHSEQERTINEEEEEEKPVMAIISQENKSGGGLPECLLLMMCEPKLSMEVSKETWVRGTDFIRLLPERPRKPAKTAATGGDYEPVKRRPSIDSKSRPRVPAPPGKRNDHQPPRSSCSLPAASMAAVIEREQGKCEPFALTRCKSEPMSTAAAKLMPESC